jgi:hypothetical protein
MRRGGGRMRPDARSRRAAIAGVAEQRQPFGRAVAASRGTSSIGLGTKSGREEQQPAAGH